MEPDYVVLPTRDFMDKVGDIFNYVPETFNFNEEMFIGFAIDSVFNDTWSDTRDFIMNCFSHARTTTDEEREMILDIVENKFVDVSDSLRFSYDQYRRLFRPRWRVDLVKINWASKSLVLKLL